MLNIAIICKTFLKGGTEKQALILAKLFTEKGIHVTLINLYGSKVDSQNLDFIRDNSIKYYSLKGIFLTKFISFLNIIRKENITVVLSYLTLANLISGLSKLFIKDIKIIGGIRNESLPAHKLYFEKWIHNWLNDATIFNNYSAKNKFIKKGFNHEKIYVIHNAIGQIPANPNGKVKREELRIITVSRFVNQKDFGTALRSFRNLINRNPQKILTYYIVGYGLLEKEIRSLARQLTILDRTKILINPPNIQEILFNCDIFLSTSLFEGLSNSIMEAMLAGLPVVATDVGDNSYLIRNGFNGFLVPCRDEDKIVEKLEYLSGSEDLRREFGGKSRTIIENNFSKEKLLENYLVVLNEITQMQLSSSNV